MARTLSIALKSPFVAISHRVVINSSRRSSSISIIACASSNISKRVLSRVRMTSLYAYRESHPFGRLSTPKCSVTASAIFLYDSPAFRSSITRFLRSCAFITIAVVVPRLGLPFLIGCSSSMLNLYNINSCVG